MKKFLSIMLGLGLILGSVSTTFAQSTKKHGKRKGGGHKSSGTRSGPAK
jgi:hypothetical protein